MYCSATKFLFAHAVLTKGPGENRYAADAIAGSIAWLGHVRVILRSDNEPALVSLKEALAQRLRVMHGTRVVMEESARYDPQSNGAAESAVKLATGGLHVAP